MQRPGRSLCLLTGLLLVSTVAPGYYHFTHFSSRFAPYTPIAEKFDLTALPNKTVSYFITDQNQPQMLSNDSLAGLVSQVRLAAKVWNDIDASDLRLAFGGFETPGTPQSTPGIDITFDELAPGIEGYGGTTIRGGISSGPNGQFVPIGRSHLIIGDDLTQTPSYSEGFFNTLVHEFGHTLGLQHTFTSGAMATEVTRATSKGKPLSADDIAGISVLYPSRPLLASTGSIAGRVTLAGNGVNLASVVALQPNGIVISELTNPDGTYRIDGLPAGQYYVYAHPVPPALQVESSPGNLVLPVDAAGQPFAAGSSFDTIFYPGVKDYTQASTISVTVGNRQDGVNFNVQRRNFPALYAVQTFSFFGSQVVKPPFLNVNLDRPWIAATGVGMTVNGQPAPGLGVTVIGGSAGLAAGGLHQYSPTASQFVEMDFQFFNPFSAPEGPRHLQFSLNNDVYILPAGIQQVQKLPPAVRSVLPGFDSTGARVAVISGTNFFGDTRVLFDGQAGVVKSVSADNTQMLVAPPAAVPGYRANVVALNTDGQSSLFISAAPPIYTYDTGDPTPPVASLLALPAGTEAMIEVFGNSNFDPQSALGFGSSDVAVKRIWVTPSRITANIVVQPNATSANTTFSVISGFQISTQTLAFQIQPFNPRQLVLNSPVINPATGQASLVAGGTGVVNYSNPQAPLTPSNTQLSVGGLPAQVLAVTSNQITFQVPASLTPGPVAVRLQDGSDFVYPIAAQVDLAPPAVSSVLLPGNVPADLTHNARPGDPITLIVTNAGDPSQPPALSRFSVNVGGLDHSVVSVSPYASVPGALMVQFVLSNSVQQGAQVPWTISLDGRLSVPYSLFIHP